MKQCDNCKTYKKANNCIKCVIKAETALRNVKDILINSKNDNGKIIMLHAVIEAYKK